jgi:GNAT superfamily N-acetyltransferase
MTALRLDDLGQYSDTLRLHGGQRVTVRFVEPRDAEALQGYFRALSGGSRYNRLFGAATELPHSVLNDFVHVGVDERFSVIATMAIDGFEQIVAEVRYAFNAGDSSLEFGLSVIDRWQGHGIGSVLMKNLECRAAALGATRLFGDTLRSNATMMRLARKSGFAFLAHPRDWKLVRFEKHIDTEPRGIPCASWRVAAEQIALRATA